MTTPFNRRQFIHTLGMGSIGAIALASCAQSHQRASLVLHNANIFTSNPRYPKAQAIAIADGKILAVGSNEDILHLTNSSTQKIDVGGKTITPGFIDAHSHPASSGRQHLKNVDCDLRIYQSHSRCDARKITQHTTRGMVTGL